MLVRNETFSLVPPHGSLSGEYLPSGNRNGSHLKEFWDVVQDGKEQWADQEVALAEALAQGTADGPVPGNQSVCDDFKNIN